MQTFAEEILLLTLDDGKGAFKELPPQAMRSALVGALLMELALADRIDTDLQALKVVNTESTGNPLLDEILLRLQASPSEQTTAYWLNRLSLEMQDLQQRILRQLVEKGVLKVENHKILWVFAVRRYPLVDNREVKEVRARLRDLILGDDIPDPRDAVLIGLVHACGLIEDILTEKELADSMSRLTELARIELIGREVERSTREIFLAMTPWTM